MFAMSWNKQLKIFVSTLTKKKNIFPSVNYFSGFESPYEVQKNICFDHTLLARTTTFSKFVEVVSISKEILNPGLSSINTAHLDILKQLYV